MQRVQIEDGCFCPKVPCPSSSGRVYCFIVLNGLHPRPPFTMHWLPLAQVCYPSRTSNPATTSCASYEWKPPSALRASSQLQAHTHNKINTKQLFLRIGPQSRHKRANKWITPHIQSQLKRIRMLIEMQPLTRDREVRDSMKNLSIRWIRNEY